MICHEFASGSPQVSGQNRPNPKIVKKKHQKSIKSLVFVARMNFWVVENPHFGAISTSEKHQIVTIYCKNAFLVIVYSISITEKHRIVAICCPNWFWGDPKSPL